MKISPWPTMYLKYVLATARKDRAEWNFEATKAVLFNAFKVMAIKDEVYVAHLLTSPEKRERDRSRFHIDEAKGDRLEYRHVNRPEFVLFGRSFRWDMETRDWQLRIVRRMKFLRRWLPGWHQQEREFRDWYLKLVDQFDADTETAYRLWVEILKVPENVRGFREIRKPLMEEAKRKVETLLRSLRETEGSAAIRHTSGGRLLCGVPGVSGENRNTLRKRNGFATSPLSKESKGWGSSQ